MLTDIRTGAMIPTSPSFSSRRIEVDPALEVDSALATAAQWIAAADAVLIVAGAGMSGYPPHLQQNVYVDPSHFKKQYPDMVRDFGIRIAYETMHLTADPPEDEEALAAVWSYWARHYMNLRWLWEPNEGYGAFARMVRDKDYFVLTSNVDGCFERTEGFDSGQIYTPQGDIAQLQCHTPCRPDAVWASENVLRGLRDRVLSTTSQNNLQKLSETDIPRCPYCEKKTVVLNLRAGGNFLHSAYCSAQDRFVAWTEAKLKSKARLVVVEVGAGINSTPTVTRFPAESIVREAGANGALIRFNPGKGPDGEVPRGLQRAIAFAQGWEKLGGLVRAVEEARNRAGAGEAGPSAGAAEKGETGPSAGTAEKDEAARWPLHPATGENRHWAALGARFDWRQFMLQLRR